MPTTKQQVQEVLDQLPEDCTIEDVQYHLYVADLIRRRAEASDKADGIPHADVVKRFAKWRTQLSGSPQRRKTSRKSPTTSAKAPRRTRTA
jgi:hypothetical protein